MCIICVSKQGVKQPTAKQIRAMFDNNPHGAGYMVARNGVVEIHKGFMDCDEYLKAIDNEHFTTADSVVYHFRISTQAGVQPQMTHPFPLTNKLTDCCELDLKCPCGVAHNGIIHLTSDYRDKVYNDTARFITQYLVEIIRKPEDLQNEVLLDIIYHLTNSKWAIMDKSGYIATVGQFIEEENGLLFSNSTYAPRLSYITWR